MTNVPQGLKRDSEKDPDVVYHYTNVEGLRGILWSRALWASDVEFLNDAQELTYARKYLEYFLRYDADSAAPSTEGQDGNSHWEGTEARARDAIHQFRQFRKVTIATDRRGVSEALKRVIDELEDFDSPTRLLPLHVYVTCFCENGDLLSQWRGYGGTGGYAIGFRTESLKTLHKKFSMRDFDRVCYGFPGVFERGWMPEHLHPDLGLDAYLKALIMVKDPAFEEEKEWRLAILERGTVKNLAFRSSSVGIVPYLQVPFPANAVAEIIVGPGPYQTERIKGIRQLLDRRGITEVPVERSNTSLRL
ncbi:DUF2971 domain-containing protein [Streptomyces sp. NPDC005070]